MSAVRRLVEKRVFSVLTPRGSLIEKVIYGPRSTAVAGADEGRSA